MNLNNCQCSLKIIGFVIGWFGVILRSVFVIFFAVLVSRLKSSDPAVIENVTKTGLIYFGTTLIFNLLLIVGITKRNRLIILVFLFMAAIELFGCYSCTIGGIILISEIDELIAFSYFIPTALFILGISIFQWFVLVRLLKHFDIQISDSENKNNFRKRNLLNLLGFATSSASINLKTK